MKKRLRPYFKLNLVSLFLIAVSFISVTLAWFAYSGIAKVATEVNVKAWNIELTDKNGERATHEIVISLTDLYPGMDVLEEPLKIRNLGDSDATVKYSIESARILDEDYVVNDLTVLSENVEDALSHNYPFKINMTLDKHYAVANGDETYFKVSVSWPLDSGDDETDSYWGTKAYEFQNDESQNRSSIQIVINLVAQQYLEIETDSDVDYNLGEVILYDINSNQRCYPLGGNCIQTYIIDTNNTLNDDSVTLLPNPLSQNQVGTYYDYDSIYEALINTWNVETRFLSINDIMKIIAKDITESVLIRDNISDSIIGNLNKNVRIQSVLNKAIVTNGYFKFENSVFNYLASSECYWIKTDYGSSKAFSIEKIDDKNSKVFGKEKTESCKVIPVIIAPKESLK